MLSSISVKGLSDVEGLSSVEGELAVAIVVIDASVATIVTGVARDALVVTLCDSSDVAVPSVTEDIVEVQSAGEVALMEHVSVETDTYGSYADENFPKSP